VGVFIIVRKEIMMTIRWVRSFALAAAFGLLAASAHAGDALFSRFESSAPNRQALALDPSYHALADSPATASLELVQANANLINLKTASLDLNLEKGLDLRAYRVNSYVMNTGSTVWYGVIENPGMLNVPFSPDSLDFDPINTVMLVKNGKTITGNVHFNGEWYKIRPLKTGGHAIVAVNHAAMPADHPKEYAKLPTVRMPAGSPLDKADTVIRVMVHYTSSAASASGNISALIDLAVAEANQGYTNSGVLIDLILAHKSQVTYTQSGSFSTDLSRYRGTADGYMDSVHTTRNSVTADVGLLVINNSSSCGLASGIGSSASTAFADAHWDCITGYYSFAHEIGHLQSARHDPANDPSTSPYAYGHGYQYNGNPKWRTIMAYACSGGCPRLNYWSNPSKLYNGLPMGTTSTSDNTRVLNNTRGTVAAFR
jgi:peptidyl-Asp metalloendopeptidase